MTATTAAVASVALLCGGLLLVVPATANVTGRAGFGGQCTSSSECTTINAECIAGKCACNDSDIQVGNKCFLPVGGRCVTRSCDADNSICSVGFCVCKPNFIQTYNNTYCYEVPDQYNEYCEKDNDCNFLTEGGRCTNNRCRCSDTTALNDKNKCVRKIDQLGSHCIKETEVCYLERDKDKQKVECRDNICKCKEGVQPSKDNLSCGGADALQAMSLTASVLTLLIAKVLA